MKRITIKRLTLSMSAAALLAGCGGSQPPIGAPGAMREAARSVFTYRTGPFFAPRRRAAPAASSPNYKMSDGLLYVVNLGANSYELGDVAVYNAKKNDPAPIAIITNGIDEPQGDCIDAAGTLYVPQNGSIAEYAAGQTEPLQYITRGQGSPAACAIDSKGNLWVAAISDVIEYLKGSNQPHKFIENGVTWANSVVFDRRGNMYVGNLGDTYYGLPFDVEVYRPGRNAPSRTITDGIIWPVGTAVDTNNTLYVTNDNAPCNVEEYRVGESHPFRTITDEIDGPTGLAFDGRGRLYEVNGGTQGCTYGGPYPVILEFRSGAVKPSRRMISTRLYPAGVAYYPPQLP